MNYVKSRDVQWLDRACVIIFQICVIANYLIGFDARWFILSKVLILLFFGLSGLRALYSGQIHFGRTLIAPVLFIYLLGFSCLWADFPSVSISQLGTQVQLFILFFCTYILFIGEKVSIKAYFDALYISGLGMALFAVSRYGISGVINGLTAGNRIGGAITNENVFGIVFSQASLSAFYYWQKNKKIWSRVLYGISVVIFVFFAFSSGSKKAFLMILVGIIAICMFEYGVKRIWKTMLICSVSLIALFWLLQQPIFAAVNERIMGFFAETKDSSELVRENLIQQGLMFFSQKPILGHGLQSFSHLSTFGGYSHNNMIEVLVSSGIVGFVLFYIPFLNGVWAGFSYGIQRRDYVGILLFIFTIINLVFGYAMVEFYDKDFWFFFGVMVAYCDKNQINVERRIINETKYIRTYQKYSR